MAFGMGSAGWYTWPYTAYWMRQRYPYGFFPYYASPWFFTREEEEDFLKGQANILEDQLAQIKKRLEDLKKQKKETK